MRKILLILFLLLFSLPLPALAEEKGWENYSFRLDDAFSVRRTSPVDIFIYRGEEPLRPGGDAGPLWALAWDDKFIYGKYYALKEGKPDDKREFYTIVPKDGSAPLGPFDEKFFLEKAGGPKEWATIRQAYKRALREGRADYSEVNRYLLGQLTFALMKFPYITLYSFLPGFLLSFYLRSRGKSRPVIKGWLYVLSVIMGAIILVALFGWLDLRFF